MGGTHRCAHLRQPTKSNREWENGGSKGSSCFLHQHTAALISGRWRQQVYFPGFGGDTPRRCAHLRQPTKSNREWENGGSKGSSCFLSQNSNTQQHSYLGGGGDRSTIRACLAGQGQVDAEQGQAGESNKTQKRCM